MELPRNPCHDVSSRDPIPGKYLRGGSLIARRENNSSDEVPGIGAASPAPCPEFVRALQVQGIFISGFRVLGGGTLRLSFF